MRTHNTRPEPFPNADETLRLAMHQSIREYLADLPKVYFDHCIPTMIRQLEDALAMTKALQCHVEDMEAGTAKDYMNATIPLSAITLP